MAALSRLLLCFASLLLATAGTAASMPAATVLEKVQKAYGGSRWDHIAALQSEGNETGQGLSGAWSSLVDIHSGHFIDRWHNQVFSVSSGMDAKGHWHQSYSGLVVPDDSDEAQTVAVSESWLRRFGFLTRRPHATFRLLPDGEENGHRYIRLEATPEGGRELMLWIDPATYRLNHVVWQDSFLRWTQRYDDYRLVDGLQLPFRITTSSALAGGTSHGTNTDVADRIHVLPETSDDQTGRPPSVVHDVTMAHDAAETVLPMHLEGGILLVEASINGKGPMPFILDTGGQAILTTAAAKRLGVEAKGSGVSAGSGPGSMTTAYAKVDHLKLGDADIRDQVFVIMPFPYSFYQRGTGREPIAGILGLEIFQRFAVTFDYEHGKLILQPFDQGTAPKLAEGVVMPIRFTSDMPLVHATLDGRPGIFGVDTGNSGYTLVFPQWAERQGLRSYYEKGLPYLTGGAGGLYTAHLAHAHSLQLGCTRVDNVLAMLTRADAGATGNPSEAGNIGQDVLARFNVYFNYRRQEMVLMRRGKAPAWHYAMAGFRAEKEESRPNRYRVSMVIPGSPAEKAGLKTGDDIVAFNGKPASALGVGDLWDLISLRPEGTVLTLTMANGRALTMKLRDMIPR